MCVGGRGGAMYSALAISLYVCVCVGGAMYGALAISLYVCVWINSVNTDALKGNDKLKF